MTFPELPKGYRWRVAPHVNGAVEWVVIAIEYANPFARFFDSFSGWLLEDYYDNWYRTSVNSPSDQSVEDAARKLHERFMAHKTAANTLPHKSRQWESKLNGAMQ
ncbi:hypothetical protein [Mycolicibacterium septicum]|uniref:hypothetical protein n=1 Tax=Mycolicibacterium septicum TaxID=98668 RepID=UPI001AF929C2|nr:hypothetical protein [Mycolicibacterium septicum]QRY51783.1 hypothetical protein JVX95_31155 [Mycolicibacterium septicum]